MRRIDARLMQRILSKLHVSKAFMGRFSFAVVNDIESSEWNNYEIIGLRTKDRGSGVLLMELDGRLYSVLYDINEMRDRSTGLSKPIICDFCKTWQTGGRAGSITFHPERRLLNSISFLCCLDLNCSLHVRDMTEASKLSRVQLREDVSREYRIERLKDKLALLAERLNLEPIVCNI